MEKIITLSKQELDKLINRRSLGVGSQGTIFDTNDGYVIKYYDEFAYELDLSEKELLSFSDIYNDGYYFIKQVIYVDSLINAVKLRKCKGNNISEIEPNNINLDSFENAYNYFNQNTIDISKNRIKVDDIAYNMMYDGIKLGAIDTDYYSYDAETEDLYQFNISKINLALAEMLVDGRFNKFINSKKELKEIYKELQKFKKISFNYFLALLRKELSEYCDKRIIFLNEAKKAIRKTEPKYVRVLKLEGLN